MSRPSITLERTDSESVRRVESLLRANDLPYEDVRANPERFFLARADGTRIGAGGVEPYGSAGLLRSVVVADSHRGQGYGAALCDALEDRARADGVATLYLLTTTATAFFRRRGYAEIPRESVPPDIRQTTEFADLCPETAACMRKRL